MVGEVVVGAIGANDSLKWVPLDERSGGRIHKLVCLYPCLIHIVTWSHV